jgi:transcriptional regulator, XRE family
MEQISNRLVGQCLRDLRTKQRLTQEAVAERLAGDQAFVSKVESGERGVKLGEIFAFADALGIETFEMIDALSKYR